MRYRKIVVRRRTSGGEQLDDDAIERLERKYPPTDFAFGSDGKLFSLKPDYRERMDPAGRPALLDAIRDMHGVESTWLEAVPVHETLRGETVWQGAVQVFAVEHPQARRHRAVPLRHELDERRCRRRPGRRRSRRPRRPHPPVRSRHPALQPRRRGHHRLAALLHRADQRRALAALVGLSHRPQLRRLCPGGLRGVHTAVTAQPFGEKGANSVGN